MIVDAGPWIFGGRVVVPTSLIEHVDGAGKTVELPLGKDDVKEDPEYEPAREFDPSYVDALPSYLQRASSAQAYGVGLPVIVRSCRLAGVFARRRPVGQRRFPLPSAEEPTNA